MRLPMAWELWGVCPLLQGDLAQAHKLLSEAVTIATEFRFHEMLGYLQAFLGLATLYHGTIAEARRILCENHRFCTDLKDKGLVVRNSIYLAETALCEDYVVTGPRRLLVDTALVTVQAALEPAVFAEAFAAGQQMSLEEAFASILAPSSLASA